MSRLVRAAIFTLAAVAAVQSGIAARATAPGTRVVAIGDVHGDIDALIAILGKAQLVDPRLKWSGGDATLVQLGDMVDRGSHSRAVMDLLMALQKDAPRQGGRVVVLLGNHEAMNLFGDVRYVTPADDASFADGESSHRRTSAYSDYAAVQGADSPALRTAWLAAHPVGFVEHRAALRPDGQYGKWLRSLPAVARVDDTIFAHGGISPGIASWSVDRINAAIAGEIRSFDESTQLLIRQRRAMPFFTIDEMVSATEKAIRSHVDGLGEFLKYDQWLSVRDDGPLWFRGYAEWTDAEGGPLAAQLAAAFKTPRFVVGHTAQAGAIVSRFDGKVYLIDTGMVGGKAAGGRPSALVIQSGIVSTIYAGEAKAAFK